MNQLQAELYALTHRGNPGDEAFYATACKGATRVLELGAGYGRLIPTLARIAEDVVALECDPSLLRATRRRVNALPAALKRRVSCVHADMQSFESHHLFERIILPYNGLYCMLNRRAILSCFRRVRKHLTENGQFIFDVWTADEFERTADSAAHYDDTEPVLSIEHRNQIWDVFETSQLTSRYQRLDVLYTYVPRSKGPILRIHIAQRYAPAKELFELLQTAGLKVAATYGGFSLKRHSPRSPFLVVKATRANYG